MARSQTSFSKKEKEKKRLKKQKEKRERREERKTNPQSGGGLENMMAYIDENGNISDTPPDEKNKKKIDAESIEIGVPKKEKEEVPTERKGRVEFFNDQKGYGFIKEQATQEKYFVHINDMLDDIREGDLVTYSLKRGMKGMNAVEVRKAEAKS